MSIKRFFAKTTSEALRKVRDVLGPDAIILSNRAIDGGIEILASHHDHISSLIPSQAGSEPDEAAGFEDEYPPAFRRAPRVLADKETKAKRGESGNGMTTISFSSWKDSLKRVERASIPENGPPRRNAASSGDMAKSRRTALRDFAVQHLNTSKNESEASRFRESDHSEEPIKARSTRKPDDLHASQFEASPLEAGDGKKRRISSSKAAARTDAVISSQGIVKPAQVPLFDARQFAEEVSASVIREISSMRGALEQQLTLLNWNGQEHSGGVRANSRSRLLDAGFSVRFADRLLDQLMDVPDAQNDEKQVMAYIRGLLAENLETIESEDEILEKGGIYALVGPTGVGKTTTTAKLAARCVIRHGAEKLALLTTDGYRIGGHEQLRIYGKILGVPVHAVRDAQDLNAILPEFRSKHMVLIDTMGMSQRDEMVAEQVAMFSECNKEIKRLLLLNASSGLQTLNEVASAYRGSGLAGAIITKVDEAVASGCTLETAIRHRLPLYYVSTGQRVPEDLELANPGQLISAALDSSPAFTDSLPADLFRPIAGRAGRTGARGNIAGAALD